MSKQQFTNLYLSAVLRAATGGTVTQIRYNYLDVAKLEQVTVYFDTGFSKVVDVTGDSLVALAYDVLKAVM